MSSASTWVCPPPRTSQACDRCRHAKARCLLTTKPPTCDRCLSKGYVCVVSKERKPSRNPRRIYASHGKQSQPRNPGDLISSLGFQQENSNESSTSLEPFEQVQYIDTHHSNVIERLFGEDQETSTGDVVRQANDGSNLGSISQRPSHDRAFLDTEIDGCLQRYETVLHYFPFLPSLRGWSAQGMKRNRPFLLLGILSAMTLHQLPLNSPLHTQFLRVLAERAVVRGEKCLDIIQGVLVQLAWYPLHLDPRSRSIFEVLRIVIAMIQDLGFDKLREEDASYSNLTSPDFIERKQSYIACCQMSSIIAVSFHRINALHFKDGTTFCESIKATEVGNKQPWNDTVQLQILLQRIAERADQARHANETNWNMVRTNSESLRNDFEEILKSMGREPEKEVSIRLAVKFAETQIHGAVFPRKSSAAGPSDAKDHEWAYAALKRCLDSTKEFLETFLSLPIPEYQYFSFVQWAQLVQVLKLVPRLSFDDLGIPQWDTARVRKDACFGAMLESLCFRMHELTAMTNGVESEREHRAYGSIPQPGHFLMFKSVLKILKQAYDERCQAIESNLEPTPRGGSQCPVLNGSIKTSEFWDALQYCNMMDADLFGGDLGELDMNMAIDGWEMAYDC